MRRLRGLRRAAGGPPPGTAPDVHPGHRADPLHALRAVSSPGSGRAVLAAFLRRCATRAAEDRARHARAAHAAVAARAERPAVSGRAAADRRASRRDPALGRGRRARGATGDLPKVPVWSDDWQLGTPDLVVTLPRPYRLAAGKHDVFRNVIVRTTERMPRHVRAIEFRDERRAGASRRSSASILVMCQRQALDGADGQPGFEGMTAAGRAKQKGTSSDGRPAAARSLRPRACRGRSIRARTW